MNSNRDVALAWILCLSVLSACSTPRAVRNLAERTATNAGVISAQLNRVAQESKQLADLRAANVAQLHAANTALRASYNYDLALTKKSGAETNLDLIPRLEGWLTEVEEIFKASDNAEKERKAAILATQTKLDTKSEALAEIAQALATLAREESMAERASFLAGFAKQLAKEFDTQLEQSNKSSTHAKELLNELKKKF
jgi:hypothetical protein